MATKRVYVYKVPGLFDSYKVFPPVIVLDKNDKFELVNTVDKPALLTLPDGFFQGPPVHKDPVGPKNKSGEKTPNPGPFGAEYKIEVDGKDAHGNSDPVIIIDM